MNTIIIGSRIVVRFLIVLSISFVYLIEILWSIFDSVQVCSQILTAVDNSIGNAKFLISKLFFSCVVKFDFLSKIFTHIA